MRAVVILMLTAIASALWALEPQVLRVGTVSLLFPDGWSFEGGTNQRAEGHGPAGENVIVTYRVLKIDAPREAREQHLKAVRGFAAEKMPDLAAKNGEVVRTVTEAKLADDRVQFSTVTQGRRSLRDYYFLQYLLGSGRSLVYLTVEGFGSAVEAADRFEKVVATQQWNE